MEISAATKLCAVIGDPVEHSLSPAIHNAAFKEVELDYVYVAFHVPKGKAAQAAEAMRVLGIRGLSVTIPHKVDIIKGLDEVDELARGVGSVNTVVNRNGTLFGTSTDGLGALRALEAAGVSPQGRRILLLGSGGAARAIAFALSALDPLPELRILGIEREERRKLSDDLARRTRLKPSEENLGPSSLEESMAWAQIVVHATPVGMTPKTDESLIPPELIRPEHTIFDVVYTPLETKLLKEAAQRGARTVPGLGMFVHQAAAQFELWTGKKAPVDLMTKVVTEALSARSS